MANDNFNPDGSFGIPDWLQSIGSPSGDTDYSEFGPYAGNYWGNTIDGETPFSLSTFLPSKQIGNGDMAPITGDQGGLPDLQEPSFITKLLGLNRPEDMADIGSLFGKMANGENANRAMKGNFTQNYDQLMLQAQNARNQNEDDALHKLAVTGYLKDGGSHYKPPTMTLNGKQMAPMDLGFGPRPATEAQKAGASDLEAQLLKRLQPGGSYTPTDLSTYANPGKLENIGKYGDIAAGGLGQIGTLMNYGPQHADGGFNFGQAINTAKGALDVGKTIASLFG